MAVDEVDLKFADLASVSGSDSGHFVIKGGTPYSRVTVPNPPDDIALRQWAFERAQQIIGTTALTEDVIESADAILAWVTKRKTA